MNPVPDAFPELIACEHCDTIFRRRPLAKNQVARCERCDAVLYRFNRMSVDQWLALTVAAAIAFVIANVSPIVYVSFQGQRNESTLTGAMFALAHGPSAPIAVPAAMAVIVVPFLQIAALGWLLAFARGGRRAPGFTALMRLMVVMRPWSMVEVLLLGILVSIVKLSGSIEVVAGAGVWATAALTVLIAIVASRDVHRLWDLVDPATSSRVHA
jgi:paraquat-inducible protein A